ncbi:MAG: negative regulator of septation ring formation, partial [Rhodoplanes sp.]
MANIPQKSNDPAQQTLSAIEEALRMREPEPARGASAPREQAEDLFQDDVAAPSWSEDRPRPANDDREAIGKILQTLQRRPSRTPYLIATTFSLLWVIGGVAFALLFRSKLTELLAQPDVAAALLTATAAAIILPVAVAFALAQTVRRTQELRNVAQTMAEVTMRLYEPETAAREQIVNVGQAVRREVAAMGDGIERALARAAELEALVHNEVSALERAYNDN